MAVRIGGESGTVAFQCIASKFPATLDILADMLVNPAFPAVTVRELTVYGRANAGQAAPKIVGMIDSTRLTGASR